MKKDKPDWWPENPYPADVFPLTMQAYADLIDAETRTAVSGCLGRFFWDIASDQIFAAMHESHVDWLIEQATGPMSRNPEHTDLCNDMLRCANAISTAYDRNRGAGLASLTADEPVRCGVGDCNDDETNTRTGRACTG